MKLQIRLGTLFFVLLFGSCWLLYSLSTENNRLRKSIKGTKIANKLLVIEDPSKIEFIRDEKTGFLLYLPDNGTDYVLCFRSKESELPIVIPLSPGEHEIDIKTESIRGIRGGVTGLRQQLESELRNRNRSRRSQEEFFGQISISVDGKEKAICRIDDKAFWLPKSGSMLVIFKPNWAEHQFPEQTPFSLLSASLMPEKYRRPSIGNISELLKPSELRSYLTIEDGASIKDRKEPVVSSKDSDDLSVTLQSILEHLSK